jgi:ankyrin repeat protein
MIRTRSPTSPKLNPPPTSDFEADKDNNAWWGWKYKSRSNDETFGSSLATDTVSAFSDQVRSSASTAKPYSHLYTKNKSNLEHTNASTSKEFESREDKELFRGRSSTKEPPSTLDAQGKISKLVLRETSPEYNPDTDKRRSTFGESNRKFYNRWKSALWTHNINEVEQLVIDGFRYDLPITDGMFILPLRDAVMESLPVTKALLEAGAAVDGTLFDAGTALQSAMDYKDSPEDMVELLLSFGADPNAPPGFLGTALEAAILKNKLEIVDLLLENGADVNQVDGNNFGTALITAIELHHSGQDLSLVKRLLNLGADPNAVGPHKSGNCLTIAIKKPDILKLLLEHGADCNEKYPLLLAAQDHNLEAVLILLDNGARTDPEYVVDVTALAAAAYFGYQVIALLLLEYGASLSNFTSQWEKLCDRHRARHPIPEYLYPWQAACAKTVFPTVNKLLHASWPRSGLRLIYPYDVPISGGIRWEWEFDDGPRLEAMNQDIDLNSALLLLDQSDANNSHRIQALAIADYILRWHSDSAGLVFRVLDAMSRVIMSGTQNNEGQFARIQTQSYDC